MAVQVLTITYNDGDESWHEVEVFASEARASNRQDFLESGEEPHVQSTHLWLNCQIDYRTY